MNRAIQPTYPKLLPRFWYRLLAALCVLVPWFAAPSSALAAGPFYLSFSVPNSTATYPLSMNDLLTVTGYYLDQAGTAHGFVRAFDGRITTIDVPGSLGTKAVAINDAGVITGYYLVAGGYPTSPLGFVRSARGVITTFGNTTENPAFEAQPDAINASGEVIGNYPSDVLGSLAFLRTASGTVTQFTLSEGAAYSTFVTGLNKAGNVVGYFSSEDIKLGNGFFWNGQGAVPGYFGGYTQITYPGATGTFPTGIDSKGNIVGCYSIGMVFYDFVRASDGTFTTLSVPGTVPSCTATLNYNNLGEYNVLPAQISVNSLGTMVGFTTSGNATSGFLRFANGRVTPFAIPGSTTTVPTSLNNFDVLTGYYNHGSTTEGFIALP